MIIQDLYQKTILFAGNAHKKQFMPHTDIPYAVHLANVAMEVIFAHETERFDLPFAVQTALMHDIIEDTHITYEDIEEFAGADVARAVQALTKDKNLSGAERMIDSLERIMKCPKEAAIVKMADRITNLQRPPAAWNHEKIARYHDESIVIAEKLGHFHDFLFRRLKDKITEYSRYY